MKCNPVPAFANITMLNGRLENIWYVLSVFVLTLSYFLSVSVFDQYVSMGPSNRKIKRLQCFS